MTALVSSGQITTVEYVNRSVIGRIRVCKSAGQGLEDGLPFEFTATRIDVSDGGTVTVNTGDCDEMILEEGSYLVTETLAPGSKASGISCSPGPHCSNADLDTRSVQAGVVGGTITHVSYTNSTTLGTLRVCKSAGPGAEPGTNFDFTALNTSGKVVPVNLTLPADDCGEVTLEEGDYELSEKAMPLVKLSGMSCGPGHLCGQLDLANRTMMLTIVGNQIVFAVAADDCSDIALEEGGYELFENAVDEVRVSGIGCTPSHLCGTSTCRRPRWS